MYRSRSGPYFGTVAGRGVLRDDRVQRREPSQKAAHGQLDFYLGKNQLVQLVYYGRDADYPRDEIVEPIQPQAAGLHRVKGRSL